MGLRMPILWTRGKVYLSALQWFSSVIPCFGPPHTSFPSGSSSMPCFPGWMLWILVSLRKTNNALRKAPTGQDAKAILVCFLDKRLELTYKFSCAGFIQSRVSEIPTFNPSLNATWRKKLGKSSQVRILSCLPFKNSNVYFFGLCSDSCRNFTTLRTTGRAEIGWNLWKVEASSSQMY
jgi:hypothetical protein